MTFPLLSGPTALARSFRLYGRDDYRRPERSASTGLPICIILLSMAAIAAYLLVAGSHLDDKGRDVAVYVPGQPKQSNGRLKQSSSLDDCAAKAADDASARAALRIGRMSLVRNGKARLALALPRHRERLRHIKSRELDDLYDAIPACDA